jgi:hypothetical protein
MTGLNDDLLDGDQECVITFDVSAVESGEAYYNNVVWSFRVVNLDDDKLLADLGLVFDRQRKLGDDVSRRLGTAVQDCSTTEAGDTCTYNYPVTAFMSNWLNMIVTFGSEDTTEGTIASAQQSITFTATGSANVVTTGVNDDVDDGDQTYLIKYVVTINCKPSAGNCLDSNTVSSYTFNANYLQYLNTDDDTAGINVAQVTPWTGVTSEQGASVAYDIALTSEPTSDVTVSMVSLDTTEGQPDLSALIFTAANWNTPQRVTIEGQNDDVYDETIDYEVMVGPSTSDDVLYANAFSSTHALQNTDDDMYSLHVDWTAKNGTNEKDAKTSELGQTTTYTIRLGSEPKKSTVITAFSKDGSAAEVIPSIIVLAADNWNVGKEIIVTGKNDKSAYGDVQYELEVTPIIGDTEYGDATKVPAQVVQLTNYEDPSDLLTININTTTCVLRESGTNCVLQFNLSYWYNAEVYPFTNAFDKVKVTARTSDPTEAKLLDGGIAKETVELLFHLANWNTSTHLTILAVDDFLVDGTQTFDISLEAEIFSAGRSSRMVERTNMPASISCTNQDDDVAELLIEPKDGISCTRTSESDVVASRGCTFAVGLKSQPAAGTNVEIIATSSNVAEGTATTPATRILTFTTANWMTAQELVVQGTEDSGAFEGGAGTFQDYNITLSATSADANWAAMANVVMMMQNEDNDLAGLKVLQNGLSVSGALTPVDEMGATSVFTVSLESFPVPTSAVTVTMSVSDASEISLSMSSIVFTTTDFESPQTVTVTGLDDYEGDGDKLIDISFSLSSSDPSFNGGDPWVLGVYNLDDDQLVLTNTVGTTTEAGGQFNFGVKMRSWRPEFESFTVQVDEDVGPAAILRKGTAAQTAYREGRVSAVGGLSSLVFDSTNYNIAKVLTVTGVDDYLDDGNQTYMIVVTPILKVTGKLAKEVAPLSVVVTNVDDDNSGLQVVQFGNKTSEGGGPFPGRLGSGGTASFTVKPTSEPFTGMRVEIVSSDTTEGVVSVSSVHFSPTTWTIPQTITVTGVDDFVYDYPQAYTVNIASAISSDDENYQGQQHHTLHFVNDDDDRIGLEVSKIVPEINGTTSENKLIQASVWVSITSQPKDTVLFTVMSDNPLEATTNPNIIAFSDKTWMIPQRVTITGVDDPNLDGDKTYSVEVKTMYTTDPDYGDNTLGMLTATRQFTNIDDITDLAVFECPLGMYGTVSDTYVTDCYECPPGRYSETIKNVTSVDKCKACYYGTFSTKVGASSKSDCTPCPAGKYGNVLGMDYCLPCLNSTYCGIGTIIPLEGVDVLSQSTSYSHYWSLVSAASFAVPFTWFDPQYFRVSEIEY